ncbi:MAG: ATP phosphoribosyltransferase regulatory subunit [Clostridia bacterium]|nr:ATP phosphoribosyltransferase regulatory subunit [Clostridia bacterium]
MYRTMKREEKAVYELRELYERFGYMPFKMSKFEEYDLYARNKDFLKSERVITFNDISGRLMALKPDVTLSIIKNTITQPGCVRKMHYAENVYRASGEDGFREIMQTGLECMGDVDLYDLCEVISLAAESLRIIDERYVIEISHMGIVSSLVQELNLSDEDRALVLQCVGAKNKDGIRQLCVGQNVDKIISLIDQHGRADQVMSELAPLCTNPDALKSLQELKAVTDLLDDVVKDGRLIIDFSIVNSMDYYNGIVFQGYISGLPSSVSSGGQYDKLMRRMSRDGKAVGFAIYLDQLQRLDRERRAYDVDTILLYDENADMRALSEAVRELSRKCSVSAQRALPEKMTSRRVLRFKDGGIDAND